jgi:hypothetical protein
VDMDGPDGPVPLQLSNLSDPLDQDRTGKIERGGAHLGLGLRSSPASLHTGIDSPAWFQRLLVNGEAMTGCSTERRSREGQRRLRSLQVKRRRDGWSPRAEPSFG